MPQREQDLGKPVAVYGLAPAQIQRAVFVVVLSFLFFLGTMFAYYIRENFLYFLLATAFLIIYLVTLFSFVSQRKAIVRIYERGIAFKKQSAEWSDIRSIADGGVIVLSGGRRMELPSGLYDLGGVVRLLRSKSKN